MGNEHASAVIRRQRVPIAFKERLDQLTTNYNLGQMNIACPLCHALHWKKEKISGSIAESYRFESCCKRGDVELPALKECPDYLKHLLESQDTKAKKFRQDIRQYNSALTFTSVNYTADRRPQLQHGVSCFQIHGELYHLQGPLTVRNEEQTPQYTQLFFYDPIYATSARMSRNQNLDPTILHDLTVMLQQTNPFISVYLTA